MTFSFPNLKLATRMVYLGLPILVVYLYASFSGVYACAAEVSSVNPIGLPTDDAILKFEFLDF